MGVRKIVLDEQSERALEQVMRMTGLSVSVVLKRGVLALQDSIAQFHELPAFEIYRRLDLGPGGYTLAPSTKSRLGVQRKLQQKLNWKRKDSGITIQQSHGEQKQ
jgi:hypothetical protein